MKLVEILARELHEWPETTVCYTQDNGGGCYPWTGTPIFDGLVGEWIGSQEACIDQSPIADGFKLDVANDHATAIVTREMWEAERAKLDRAVERDGDELPPVGTDCEVEIYLDEWFKCTVVGHCEERPVIVLANKETAYIVDPDRIRPIRTPEQIAAENREEGIMEMMRKSGERLSFRKICEALYDAGYRKQEKD